MNDKKRVPLQLFHTVRTLVMVGVSGFEPEVSWTRTKRDTKLRHTPKLHILYWISPSLSTPKPIESRKNFLAPGFGGRLGHWDTTWILDSLNIRLPKAYFCRSR